MTKEELIILLRNPDQTSRKVDELNRLIEEYPYFHTGHQLYLQSLNNPDKTQLLSRLKTSALHVRDRSILYDYLHRSDDFLDRTHQSEPVAVETVTSDLPESFVLPTIPNNDLSAEPESKLPDTDVPATVSGGIICASSGCTPAEEKKMSDDELKELIRRQLEQIGSPVPANAVAPDVAPAKEDIKPSDPVTKTPDAINVSDVPGNQKTIVSDESTVRNDENTHEENKPAANELIDSFLKADTKIVPTDSDYRVDLSESLREDPDVATETLADIYVSQGHIRKAIEIYEHLILKYPEKHIYFAAQIDRLKQELKK